MEAGMRFQDKVALITAAGAGIGRATADIMARDGAIVVGVDTDQARLDAMVAAIAAAGGRAHAHCANALDPAQVGAVVAGTARQFGGVDILVNAVGGSTVIARPSATVDELSFADWQKLIAFNLEGTFLFTHAVVPVMKQALRGKIVNLASIAGRGLSRSSSSAYAAAKGGIIAFTRKLAFELGPHWNQRAPEDQTAEIARVPLGRIAQAADQAKVICFLASADADFVTGVTIDVTGGQ
jgi:NAD(P)-dependent dehydrogenase (short-subunit alcohol dehydrogenase family)